MVTKTNLKPTYLVGSTYLPTYVTVVAVVTVVTEVILVKVSE